MLVHYAISYLQAKIREIENSSPDSARSSDRSEPVVDGSTIERSSSDETIPRSPEKTAEKAQFNKRQLKDLRYIRETVTALGLLAPDAPLSEITPILHGHRNTPQALAKSTYYNTIIKPLDEQLVAEQERAAKVERERLASVERERLAKAEQERLGQSSGTGSEEEPANDFLQDINTLRPTLNAKVIPKLDQLLAGVDKLSEQDAETKAKILENTYNLLTESVTVKDYQDFAKTVQGQTISFT